MVLLSSSRYLNRWLGPVLLRNGIRLRHRFLGLGTDHPFLDAALGVTIGQWLIALEAREYADEVVQKHIENQTQATAEQSASSTSNASPGLSLDEEAALRVQVLTDFVRPALLPAGNSQWSYIAQHWQFYPRLVRWLRRQFLLARYGPHVRAARQAFPALARSPQFSNQIPMTYSHLPPSSLVESSLCLLAADDGTPWASVKNRAAVVQSMRDVADRFGGKAQVERGGALCWTELPDEAVLWEGNNTAKNLALDDLLQLVGANVKSSSPLNTWLEQYQQYYQLWTREYVAGLGDYLWQRGEQLSLQGKKLTILEVGAGDGSLTALLQDYMENHSRDTRGRAHPSGSPSKLYRISQRSRKVAVSENSLESPNDPYIPPHLVATDNMSWSVRRKATVEKLDYRKALDKYAKDDDISVIVLCSWMPMNEDWTSSFLQYQAVDEYILIGEADDGQCGHHWNTWGNPYFEEDSGHVKADSPPFVSQGFERHDHAQLLPYQFSRYDSTLSKEGMTVSFRRKLS